MNFLEKNKSKLNRFSKNFYNNPNLLKKYENLKNYFTKITSRLYFKSIDKYSETKKNDNNSRKNQTPVESFKRSKFLLI